MITMTQPVRLLLVTLLLNCLLVTAPRAEVVCRVVAVVNDEVITLADLNREEAPLRNRIENQVPPDEQEAALQQTRLKVLDQLIESTLIRQRAREIGITVDDKELDRTIEGLIRKNNRSREEFLADLEKLGTTETAYRESIRQQIIEARIVNIEVRSKLVITDDMVREYYDRRYLPTNAPDGYNLLQMGFGWGATGRSTSPDEARLRAESVRSAVVTGGDFRELAATESDMPSARDGGAIGVFTRKEMASYMQEAIVSLTPGDISPVVATPDSFQFFKLLSLKEGDLVTRAPFETVQADLRDELRSQELQKLYQTWLEQLREKAYIKKTL